MIKNIFKKPAVIVVILSVLLTFIVSGLFGLGTYFIWNTFWGGALLGLALQIIGFAVLNTFLIRKDEIITAELVNRQLEAIAKYTIKLQCAYCKKPNVTPLQLHEENRFECEFCKQINGIKMQFITTQITTPLSRVALPVDGETVEMRVSG